MMMKINKGVILCGGMGTRFLPATKALPKEMLPVVDTPVLQYIADEMTKSGITRICIVVSPGKEDIVRHFTQNGLLISRLKAQNKQHELDEVESIGGGAEYTFVMQSEPRGMADALLRTESFVDGDPFVLSTGDDLVYSDVPVSKQLMGALDDGVDVVIGGQRVTADKVPLYGIAAVGESRKTDSRALICRDIVEKPALADAPSDYAALGRYVMTSAIFEKITHITPDKKGELQVTDALKLLCREGRGCFYEFEGRRYDMGSKSGAVEATIDYALRSDETRDAITAYIKGLKF